LCELHGENASVATAGTPIEEIVEEAVGVGDGANEDKEAGMTAPDTAAPPNDIFPRLQLVGLL